MLIDPKLLEILVCPACQKAVEELADEAGLRCTECARIFPVRDGIPVMLLEEAKNP